MITMTISGIVCYEPVFKVIEKKAGGGLELLEFVIASETKGWKTYVTVKAWGSLAADNRDKAPKGSQVVATCKGLKHEKYEKKDGTKDSKITANIIDIEVLNKQEAVINVDEGSGDSDDIPF